MTQIFKLKAMNRKGIIPAAIGLIALLSFIGYSFWIISKPQPLEVQGEVDATEIKVASKLVGRISHMLVHKGDFVKKGDLLFTLSSPEIHAKLQEANAALKGAEAQHAKALNGAQKEDIHAAYSNYQKALAAYQLAMKTYDRISNLYKEGVVPKQKKDESETQTRAAKETADAALSLYQKAKNGARSEDKESAKAMVNQAEGAVNEVNSYVNETKIYAPRDGEVTNIIAEEGELVSAGYPVLTIVRKDDAWVTFNLREDLLSDIKMGTIIYGRFPAMKDSIIPLRISYINVEGEYANWNATKTSGDFDMKTFEVHAIPLSYVPDIRTGMSVLVDWGKLRESNKQKGNEKK